MLALALAACHAPADAPWEAPWAVVPGASEITALAMDPAGNTVFGGRDEDTFLASVNGAGDARWTERLHDPPTAGPTHIRGLAADADGTTTVVGSRYPPSLTGSEPDAWVAGFDDRGRDTFDLTFGDDEQDDGAAVAIDGQGGAAVVGWRGTRVASGYDGVDLDPWIARFDAAHAVTWEHRLGVGDLTWVSAAAVALDPDGNVTIAGTFSDAVDFGDGVSVVGGAESASAYLARYDADGTARWATQIPGAGSLAAGPDGSVYVAGNGTWLARYDADGALRWEVAPAAADAWDGYCDTPGVTAPVAVDVDGDVFIAGTFAGTLDFGDGAHTAAGCLDVFVASYDADGALRWSQAFPSGSGGGWPLPPSVTGLAAGPHDAVAIAGVVFASLDVGEVVAPVDDGPPVSFVAGVAPP